MGAPKNPIEPQAFMPSEWAKQKPVPKKRINRRAVANQIRELFKNAVTDPPKQ